MKTHKELNIIVSALAGDAEVFELLHRSDTHTVTVKTIKIIDYSTDLNLALEAAKRIADRNNYTFVLTYLPESGEWKASFGDYLDCAEYSGGNAAYCVCMAIGKFMGKV